MPTRALANDKLAEWRARGWDVGIATGDLAENLNAPVLVATLETQKNRLIQGTALRLLVVDEYQMIRDPDRGLNYEMAIALAPAQHAIAAAQRQRGESAGCGEVADAAWAARRFWCGRSSAGAIGGSAREHLNFHVPSEIRGYWPRLIAKALAEIWADADFRAAAAGGGIDGGGIGAVSAHAESAGTLTRSKSRSSANISGKC